MSVSLIRMGPLKAFDEQGRAYRFVPQGKVYEVGDPSQWYTRSWKSNPLKKRVKDQAQGARIILGFNVGIEEKVTIQDVVDLVFKLRRQQVKEALEDGEAQPHPLGGDIGATFVAQKGLWQSVKDEQAYPENGVQVAMMNIIQEDPERFIEDMIEIADAMVADFNQNAVLIEISNNGVVDETMEVGP